MGIRILALTAGLMLTPPASGDGTAAPGAGDLRMRVSAYAADVIYRLKGYVGYQIDLQFESGESFVGLGAGDLESLSFAAQDNHLFLKPRAAEVDTNLTVLTTRRTYQFDYSVSTQRPDPAQGDVIYALRFTYPAPPAPQRAADNLERRLSNAADTRAHNLAYGYRGSAALKPLSAWDDGVQTRLRFGPRRELPAIFVRNDDGSESLLNFNIASGEVVIHRIARRLILRRGALTGCIVNKGFFGSGERLPSGTIAPDVQRTSRQAP